MYIKKWEKLVKPQHTTTTKETQTESKIKIKNSNK